MPEVAERTLPHNLEAERSVLGAILLHNDAFNLAAEVIDSKDFFRDAHRRIFDKMVKLVERGDAIDLTTSKEGPGGVGEDADVILDQAEHAIFAIADDKVRDGFVSLRDLAQSSLETIEKLHARKELVTGVPTGF